MVRGLLNWARPELALFGLGSDLSSPLESSKSGDERRGGHPTVECRDGEGGWNRPWDDQLYHVSQVGRLLIMFQALEMPSLFLVG
ncbi:hypothetical protein Acr_06g0007630 [Actinidia rufa]|uniref:Uncharacterized protein n=1 Tax=Actinidia rufa TaxID=165716 RepID=A0A7J0EQW6_9ERIC|nr:hypothetical protein Acr_06g0007630 [Actinidia rufa]